MSKVTHIFIACFFFINLFSQSGQVLKIKSSNCSYNSKGATTNFATGFVYKENGRVVGIVTALHAVCGCSSISAEDNSGTDYYSLKILKADIDNDIALLTSSEIVSNFSSGLEFSNLNVSTLANKKVSMFAYPYGVELNIDTKDARIRETPSAMLKKFVKSDVEESLKQRGSPNINNYVLNLQLEITPGCSGAPIMYDNKVIGIANGGLDEGRTHVCWAIPTSNIQLTSVSKLEPTYSKLGKLNPNMLFILTCDIEEKESNKNYWKCEQDKNIRGIILPPTVFQDSAVYLDIGGMKGSSYSYDIIRNGNPGQPKVPEGFKGIHVLTYDTPEIEYGSSLSLYINDEGFLTVSSTFYDENGCIVGMIKENNFLINTDCQFTWNFDEKGLEIIDDQFHVNLLVDYVSGSNLEIRGIIGTPSGYFIITENSLRVLQKSDKNYKEQLEMYKKLIKPRFEYVGKDWFGKRVKN